MSEKVFDQPAMPPHVGDDRRRRAQVGVRIHGGADRVSIPFRDMPKTLQQAVIATEDRRFYKHPGVNVSSIFRAALKSASSSS